jgi:DnaJ-class molecular chaperone
MSDPYSILGVPRTASASDIKKAFRKKAKLLHPDQNINDPKAKERFAELNNAHELLSDEEKRGQFDRGLIDAEGKPRFQGGFEGARTQSGSSPFGDFSFEFGGNGARGSKAGIDPSDIFAHMFGGTGPRTQGARAPSPSHRMPDATVAVLITEI